MHDTKKPTILITGAGPHLGQLAQMADAVSPNRLVWTGTAGSPPEWAAAVGGGTISSATDIGPDAIVVGGETGEDGNFAFPPNKSSWFIPDSQNKIHHPIVLSDLIPLDFSGRVIACGYPGSGNGVVQAILEAILPPPTATVDSIQNLFFVYSANYLDCITSALRDLGSRLGDTAPGLATYRENYATAHWMHDDDGSTLFGLPLRNFLFERIHKTHEMCGDKILRMCLTSDAKCVLTVRNPLDTIVSIANKSKKLVALLDTEWLLRAVARGLIAYYRSFSDAFPTGLVHVVRYEDLLVHFEKATKGLASLIGAVLTHDEIAALKSRLWNAPVAMPGHLWKPGQDKWKEYLTPRSLAILREEGIGGLMERLGYDFSGKEHVAGVPISTVPPRRPTLHGVSFFTHCMGTIEETLAEFSVNTHGMLPYASA